MGTFKYFTAHLKPSAMLKRMLKHTGDVSADSKAKLEATRTILGRKVYFFSNGMRLIQDEDDLTEEEQFNSEILRLAHASLLINDSVGDTSQCYVDARKDPVEVIVYGYPVDRFIKKAKNLIKSGHIKQEYILDQHLGHTRDLENERNVRLFGR